MKKGRKSKLEIRKVLSAKKWSPLGEYVKVNTHTRKHKENSSV